VVAGRSQGEAAVPTEAIVSAAPTA
jgi:hypothetical protein